ncbi:MAG TPA: class I SAM-dependent methyltransferase [Syntrophorhabdaceae bacterium]|nr:class I SAM-dependent methyltransferase [Syntrophorhabdaceae bacterium]
MNYSINKTDTYHKKELDSLGWELTICNALYKENTVLRRFLGQDESFGRLLFRHLWRFIPVDKLIQVLEIGGGYGYLMRDFLEMNLSIKPTMLDISPFLLERQKETLKDYSVSFAQMDFLDADDYFLRGFELAVMNENLGDFPTVVGLGHDVLGLSSLDTVDPVLKKIIQFFERYGLPRPQCNPFNFNMGAVEAVEKLCTSGIPYIYLGEHSCEASAPENLKHLIKISPSGNPERIPLRGHDEYTIKFSYLEMIAKFYGYNTIRGSFADFIPFDINDRVYYALSSQGRYSDEDEIICQFVEDLYKYEYLLLIRP